MRYLYLFVILFGASAAFAESASLLPGKYLLVCAHDAGPSADGRGALSVRHVKVVANGAELSIVVDGAETSVRRDVYRGVLFTLSDGVGVKGAAVAQAVYTGYMWTPEGAPASVQGDYRILSPGKEEKGRFALIRDDNK